MRAIERHNWKMCLKGFSHQECIDYIAAFALVPKMKINLYSAIKFSMFWREDYRRDVKSLFYTGIFMKRFMEQPVKFVL